MEDGSLIGTLFARRFHIEELIGRGGMGDVYLALHEVLRKKFAIKVLRTSLMEDMTVVARFRREARAASRIDHPHITSVFDFGHSEEGRPYIAMEYVKGPLLADVLEEEGPLSLPRTLVLLDQIADALVAAHAHHVIHRDLTPKNIVLTSHLDQTDFIKILDFGLAKIVGMETSGRVTRAGETFGTAEYMSPEQCTAQALDHRTDIYSFGILAFELITGDVPFNRDGNIVKTLSAHVHDEPPVPSEISAMCSIPTALDRMILRCLSKNPDDRFASAADLRTEIQSLLEIFCEPTAARPPKTITPPNGQYSVTLPPPGILGDKAPSNHERTLDFYYTSDADVPTEADSRYPANLSHSSLRSRAIEELAYAVRDRGLGSSDVSQVLSLKLEVEDQIMELECDFALIEASVVELDMKCQQRESRLRQILNQLEHERALYGPVAPEGALPAGIKSVSGEHRHARLEVRIVEIEQKILRIAHQRDEEMARLQERKEQNQRTLEKLLEEAEAHEEKLAVLLREIGATDIVQVDPELAHLYALAEL
jgi:serine/threonine protein kinase